jgi:hypothetical protein
LTSLLLLIQVHSIVHSFYIAAYIAPLRAKFAPIEVSQLGCSYYRLHNPVIITPRWVREHIAQAERFYRFVYLRTNSRI